MSFSEFRDLRRFEIAEMGIYRQYEMKKSIS